MKKKRAVENCENLSQIREKTRKKELNRVENLTFDPFQQIPLKLLQILRLFLKSDLFFHQI